LLCITIHFSGSQKLRFWLPLDSNVRQHMSTSVIEAFDPTVHRDHMPEVPSTSPARHVLVVSSGKFRLEFLSQAQLEVAIADFRSPSGSTRVSAYGDHREFQPWQSRLPAGINNAHNRDQVLSALYRDSPPLAKSNKDHNP
jgi:hypothetical protein